MSTTESARHTTSALTMRKRLGPPLGVAVVVSLFAALYPRDHDQAWGALCGGLGAIAVVLLVRRLRRDDDSAAVRRLRGEVDERDQRIAWEAGWWTAQAASLCCALGMVALAWRVNPMLVIGVILWVLLIVQAGANAVLQRRR